MPDEFAEAWHYGPVFPSFYHEFKEFGPNAINKHATKLDVVPQFEFNVIVPQIPDKDKQTRDFLEQVWRAYKRFSALQLSDMTHADGTPWDQTKREASNIRNADIKNDVIKRHYQQMAESNRRRQSREHA